MNGTGDPYVGFAEPLEAGSPSVKPIVIGVTGGMASGKSTVARMIAGRGIVHLDADKLVHALMQHDRPMIEEIAAAFPGVVKAADHNINSSRRPREGGGPGQAKRTSDDMDPRLRGDDGRGQIDRAALAKEIAKHPAKLATLEQIIHPRVRALEEMAIHIARRNGVRAVILDIPLLFETDAQTLCDIVVVAHAPLHHRRRRAFTRPGMTEEKWQKLLARQLPDHARNFAADIVIPTGIGKAATRRKIQTLMKDWGLL